MALLFSGVALAVTVVLFFFLPGRQGAQRPNVILIVLDAARADHFSGYGYERDTTPNMDAMGERGTVFLNHFSNASRTVESVPQILSSRYYSMPLFEQDAWRWGAKQLNGDTVFQMLDSEQILLPEVMSQNGYRTAIVHDHGYFVPPTAFVRAFDDFLSPQYAGGAGAPGKDTFSLLFDWLDIHREEPFFVYLHRMSPHEPYPAKPEDQLFLEDFDAQYVKFVREKLTNRRTSDTQGWATDEIAVLGGLYDSNLRHEDTRVGALFAKLDALGLTENTVVIITADHGENLGQHNSLGHGGPPWDSVTHIPLIVHWPSGVPAGARFTGLSENVDLMPTILELSGISLPTGKSMDGTSLVPVLSGSAPTKNEVIFAEGDREAKGGIRTAHHKLYLGNDELYELREDPEENSPKADEELRAGLLQRYEEIVKPYQARHLAARLTSPPNYPFYLPIDSFELTPVNAHEVRVGDRSSNETVLAAASPQRPWLLHGNWMSPRLFCLPGNGTPLPITLSASIPNGAYTVFALVEAPMEKFATLAGIGLRSRFTDTGQFSYPTQFIATRTKGHLYVEFGKAIVENEKFALELDWHPPDESIYVIHHIRFEPEGQGSNTEEDKDRANELERLRALGYIL
jgi:choline-sulfatase